MRSTSSVSPTPSIEGGRVGPGLLRSTFSISSISFSSGAKRRRREDAGCDGEADRQRLARPRRSATSRGVSAG